MHCSFFIIVDWVSYLVIQHWINHQPFVLYALNNVHIPYRLGVYCTNGTNCLGKKNDFIFLILSLHSQFTYKLWLASDFVHHFHMVPREMRCDALQYIQVDFFVFHSEHHHIHQLWHTICCFCVLHNSWAIQ